MTNLTTSEARQDFSQVIRRARRGERIALTRHGRVVAAVVSPEDLEFLKMVEDRFDARAADEAMRDVEINGTIPWEDIKTELGL
jgi:prevent-host-death family protein